jgi:hypothetical protein
METCLEHTRAPAVGSGATAPLALIAGEGVWHLFEDKDADT